MYIYICIYVRISQYNILQHTASKLQIRCKRTATHHNKLQQLDSKDKQLRNMIKIL